VEFYLIFGIFVLVVVVAFGVAIKRGGPFSWCHIHIEAHNLNHPDHHKHAAGVHYIPIYGVFDDKGELL
jgi:hypothetical protein